MDKVYIVTSGSYSDYEINAVFADKGKAQKYAELKEGAEVQEWGFSDEKVFVKQFRVRCTYHTKDTMIGICPIHKGGFVFDVSAYDIDEMNRNEETIYNRLYGSLSLVRPLPDTEEPSQDRKNDLDRKYLKVCQDMAAEIEAREKGIG